MRHRHWMSVLIAAAVSLPVQAEPLQLRNPHWTVEVDPATLQLVATPTDGPRIVAPPGGHAHRVSNLHYVHDGVAWAWDEGAWQFQVRLQEREVLLWTRQGDSGTPTLRRLTMDERPSASLRVSARGDAGGQGAPLHLGQLDQIELLALHPAVQGPAPSPQWTQRPPAPEQE